MSADIEHKAVEIGDIKGGVELKAGHRTIVIVNGAQGNARYGKFEGQFDEDADDPNADKPAKTESKAAEAEGPVPGTPGGDPDAKFEIEVTLTAAGGTPLAGEKVAIVDPLTEEQIGSPAVTDEKGVLKARVPEEKEYSLHVLDDKVKDDDVHADWSEPGAHGVRKDVNPILSVALEDAEGNPLKGEKVKIKPEGGEEQEATTDDEGCIHMPCGAGPITLEVRGKSLAAHSVFDDDPRAHDGAAYKFTVA